MAKADSITVERILECLHYDKNTGVFTSRIRRGTYRPGEFVGKASWKGRVTHIDGHPFTFDELVNVFDVGALPQRGRVDPGGRQFLSPRDNYLYAKFGITEADYQRMHDEQDGRCGLCLLPNDMFARRLAVDHCHKTGRVRGLLCSTCNTGIGLLRDSPAILEAAKSWVTRGWNANSPRRRRA
jgi:hypothetical protein